MAAFSSSSLKIVSSFGKSVSMTQAGIFHNLTAKRRGKKLATKESRVFVF